MNVTFEYEYLKELFETGLTRSRKHQFQPQIVKGYRKVVRIILNSLKFEEEVSIFVL